MKKITEILQALIHVPICLKYGSVWSDNIYILIFQDGKIEELGYFKSKLVNSNRKDIPKIFEELGVEAELYRLGIRQNMPSIYDFKVTEDR